LDLLDNIYKNSLIKQGIVLIITNVSLKNNIATMISHTCKGQGIIAKMTHHTTNINSTKVELFAIRCRINHVIYLLNVNHIIVIIDAIPADGQIFDMLINLYQLHSIVILKDSKKFFNKNSNNIIEFWDCLDSIK